MLRTLFVAHIDETYEHKNLDLMEQQAKTLLGHISVVKERKSNETKTQGELQVRCTTHEPIMLEDCGDGNESVEVPGDKKASKKWSQLFPSTFADRGMTL